VPKPVAVVVKVRVNDPPALHVAVKFTTGVPTPP
jgi:hypothetical protein